VDCWFQRIAKALMLFLLTLLIIAAGVYIQGFA
jgi:hypothetical protein